MRADMAYSLKTPRPVLAIPPTTVVPPIVENFGRRKIFHYRGVFHYLNAPLYFLKYTFYLTIYSYLLYNFDLVALHFGIYVLLHHSMDYGHYVDIFAYFLQKSVILV